MAKKTERLLTISEASHVVGCSTKFLRQHARRGTIDARRNYNNYLIFDDHAIEQARRLLYGDARKLLRKKGR